MYKRQPIGSTVTWTYEVTNPGNVPLSDVVVTDDNGTAATGDDFLPTFVSGDTNGDGLLDVGETWTYTATGVAIAGQYSNDAVVDGTGPDTVNPDGTTEPGIPVDDNDPSHYFGSAEPEPGIDLEKATNTIDADTPTGPFVDTAAGTVTWTYEITNTGNVPLFDLTLSDDIEGAVTCSHPQPLLAGASTTCTLTAASVVGGQYANVGTIVGTPVDLAALGFILDPATGVWLSLIHI